MNRKIILIFLIMLSSMFFVGHVFSGNKNNFKYEVIDDKIKIISYEGNNKAEIIIPDKINDKSVEYINNNTFKDKIDDNAIIYNNSSADLTKCDFDDKKVNIYTLADVNSFKNGNLSLKCDDILKKDNITYFKSGSSIDVKLTKDIGFKLNNIVLSYNEKQSDDLNKEIKLNITSQPYSFVMPTGAVVVDTALSECTSHDFELNKVLKKSTCIHNGNAEYKCKLCDYTEVNQLPLDPDNHEYQIVSITPPSCYKEGIRNKKCPCGVTKRETIPVSHSWNTSYTIDKNPTYTKAGTKSIHCKVCNEIKNGSIKSIPKLVKVSSIQFKSIKTKNVFCGSRYSLGLNIYPSNATKERIIWSSSNNKIANVSSSGVVTFKSPGKVNVYAKTIDGSNKKISTTFAVWPSKVKLKASSNGKNVKLSFSKSKGAKKYIIYRSTKKSKGYKKIKTTSSRSFTDKKVKYKKTYYYKVRAVNGKYDSMSVYIKKKVVKPAPKLDETSINIVKGSSYRLRVLNTSSKVKWTSSNKSIATVVSYKKNNKYGYIKAKRPGRVNIYAKIGKKKLKCSVNIEDIGLNKTKANVTVHCTYNLKLINNKSKIRWTTSNGNIARVSSKGVVKALKPGKAIITAKSNGKTYRCTVKVVPATITLNKTSIVITERLSTHLSAKTNGKSKKVKWKSSNKKILEVGKTGNIRGKSSGTAYVIAECNGVTAKCKVKINKYDIISVLNKLNLSGVKNLMIVAHPDDDTLWGGAHLTDDREGKYLVVSVTAGCVEHRSKEFTNAIKYSKDVPFMLGYKDRDDKNLIDKGSIFNWESNYKSLIFNDIYKIITYKKWNKVVTHSPEGEENHHRHHRWTSSIVTNVYKNTNPKGNSLFYFGHYFRKYELPFNNEKKIDNAKLAKKVKMLTFYPSQLSIINNHKHMNPYENWINADDWVSNSYPKI